MSSSNRSALIGIIANCTSQPNRVDLVDELGEPMNGFFPPLKFTYKDSTGEIIPLDLQPNEVLTPEGTNRGKLAMFSAVEYLVSSGAKVICFTASTKRLPGRLGQELKNMYPDITFSIGDNATTVSCLSTFSHFLSDNFDKANDQVVVMGVGFLGIKSVEYLIRNGCQNITVLTEQKNCFPQGVSVVNSFKELLGQIKIFISCSHKYEIDPLSFRELLRPDAIILDVAVPPGIGYETYVSLSKTVSRFDIGDLFLTDIKYSFPPQILSFPGIGFWYGCFGEAVMLEIVRQAGEDLSNYNFFEVSQANQDLVTKYLRHEQVTVPLINFFAPNGVKYIPL